MLEISGMLQATLHPRFRLLYGLLHVAGKVLLNSGKTIAEVVNVRVQLIHPFSCLPGSVVQVAHTLLELGLDAVGQLGDDLRKTLIEEDTLSCFLSVRVHFRSQICARTLFIICSRSLAEPQCLVAVANPRVPRRVRHTQPRQTRVDLFGRHMHVRFVAHRKLAERSFSKLGALVGYVEGASLEIAYSQTCRIRVDKITYLAATICKNCSLVFAIEELAVVDEQPRGDPVAERLGLQFL